MSNLDYMYEKNGFIRLSSNQLKVIAMITMLVDHIGLMLIGNGKLYGYNNALFSYVIILDSAKPWLQFYRLCRVIGRISFPIYTFCIVEGFLRTSNLFKYFLRLLVLALLSEIPFNLMVYNKFFCIDGQNVIWLYILGLITLTIIKKLDNNPFAVVIFSAIAAVVAQFLGLDYGYGGMILMMLIYIFRNDKTYRSISIAVTTFILSIQNDFGGAALSTFFIHHYDGTKGRFNLSLIFYLFYPVHMLILYFIVWLTYLH